MVMVLGVMLGLAFFGLGAIVAQQKATAAAQSSPPAYTWGNIDEQVNAAGQRLDVMWYTDFPDWFVRHRDLKIVCVCVCHTVGP